MEERRKSGTQREGAEPERGRAEVASQSRVVKMGLGRASKLQISGGGGEHLSAGKRREARGVKMGKGSRRSSAAGGWGSEGAEGRAALCLRVGGRALGWLDGDAQRGEPSRGLCRGHPRPAGCRREVGCHSNGRQAGRGPHREDGRGRAARSGAGGGPGGGGSRGAGMAEGIPACGLLYDTSLLLQFCNGEWGRLCSGRRGYCCSPASAVSPRPGPPGEEPGPDPPRPGRCAHRASGLADGRLAAWARRAGRGAGQGGGWGEPGGRLPSARGGAITRPRRQVGSAGLSR